jgi:hypothetical protein
MPFWMLCDASTVEEKKAYMRRCRAGGIKALTLHPRPGNLIPFASTEWFDMIKELATEAARLDMKLWLYDEDPYPSGAAGGLVMAERPDLRARTMSWVEKPEALKPGELWFISRQRVIWAGLAPLKGGLPPRDLTASVGPVRADWFSTEWDSRYYYNETPLFPCVRGHATRLFHTMRVPAIPAGYKLAAVVEEFVGIDGPWGSLPDLLQPETYGVFQRLGLDPYVEAVGSLFGTTIPGIFTDEAKPHGGTPFTRDLFDSFRERFGYALRGNVCRLFGEALDDQALRTRIDYRRWIMDRFLDGFVKPYRAWCDRHNLHLVGHFSPEDDPIQETVCLPSCMAIMKAMSFPGCDVIVPAVGDEDCATLNLGSLRIGSIKSQSGRRYCASESQACADWIVTSRQTRQIYAWQKMLGVDRFFTHGFWNTMDGITNLEAPPDYGPNSSIFRGTAAVNAWLEQCDAVMDGGVETADVAILDNVTAFWIWAQKMDTKSLLPMRRSLWNTILRCLQAQVGLHALDAADAALGETGPAGFTFGTRTYKTILVPACGIMPGAAFRRLQEAAVSGTRVIWFGGGPTKLVEPAGALAEAPFPGGEVRREREPSAAWCRENLPVQVAVRGAQARECYVRRFRAEDGSERLFAVNIAKEPRVFVLPDDGKSAWNPDPALADGDAARVKDGTRWSVPAYGCGLFTAGPAAAGASLKTAKRPVASDVAFARAGLNALRLDRCRITLKGRKPQDRPYPQPFWQRFKDYTATEMFDNFAGEMPVESTVAESDLRYLFTVESKVAVKAAELVLDPRCARGRFRVFCNGRDVSGALAFPRMTTTPLRLPVALRKGRNTVEFRFDIGNAMEGLLSQTWIEGAFGVRAGRGGAVVEAQSERASAKGWLDMGLAHYMGDGTYRWTETFTARDLASGAWSLELDEVMDSGQLTVNGRDQGTRAWGPWRWALSGLAAGANTFELTVSSTAGNRISLLYPAQPQGWIGKGRLVRKG